MPISPNIYQPFIRPKESAGLATLGDFWQGFQQAREQREVSKDRKAQRELQQQDRQLRNDEIRLRQQQIEAQTHKLQTDEEKRAYTQQIAQQFTTPEGTDWEAVIETIRQKYPDTADELDAQVEAQAKRRRDAKKAEFDQKKAEFEFESSQLDRDAKDRTTYLERFAAAKTPEQWADIWEDASTNKMQRVLKGTGLTGQFSPEGVAMAADLVRGVKGRDALDKPTPDDRPIPVSPGTVILDPKTKKPIFTNPARPLQGGTAPVAVIGPNGQPVYTTQQGALGQRPANIREQGPSSGVQKRVLNFFNRAKQASEELEGLEAWASGLDLGGQTRMEYAPNFAQAPEGRQYIAAQRAFTEARLRKDSGAAIPEQEFTNDRRTYFPQPGDDAKTLAQKKRARAAVLASLAFESGAALKEFYGDDAEGMIEGFKQQSAGSAPIQKEIPGFPGAVAESTDGGKTWKRVK